MPACASFWTKPAKPILRLIEARRPAPVQLAGSHGHQGVVAPVDPVAQVHSLDELLEQLEAQGEVNLLLLVLDGTDPHNLGPACAWPMGPERMLSSRQRPCCWHQCHRGQVASGAAETMPYFMVTNRPHLGELKERNIWIIGTSDDAPKTLCLVDLKGLWLWCWEPKARACAS